MFDGLNKIESESLTGMKVVVVNSEKRKVAQLQNATDVAATSLLPRKKEQIMTGGKETNKINSLIFLDLEQEGS